MTPHTSTEQITNAVCPRFRVVGDLSIEQLEAEIESLGFQAAQIELWNAEPGTPPWMRRMDAERVEKLRNKQAQLLGELALKKLRARDHLSENLPRIDVGIQPGVFPSWRAAVRAIGWLVAGGAACWYVFYLAVRGGVL